ncbi:MAG: hypothetical protein WCJ74_00245 [bacterium]
MPITISQIDQGESLPLTLKQFLDRFVTKPCGQKIKEVHLYGGGRRVREIENNLSGEVMIFRHASLSDFIPTVL